jgi:hypothetical protein
MRVHHEDVCSRFQRNVCMNLPGYTLSHSILSSCFFIPLWIEFFADLHLQLVLNGSREQKQYSGPMRHNDNICSGKRFENVITLAFCVHTVDTSSTPRTNPYVNTRQTLWHTTWNSPYSLNTGPVGGTQQRRPQQFVRRSRNEPEMYEKDDVECPRTLRYHVQRVL